MIFVFLGFIYFWSITISSDPLYDFDMVAYMGVITEYDTKNSKILHEKVYSELKREMSPQVYNQLVSNNSIGTHKVRVRCFESPIYFQQYLSFHRVKPLYTRLAYLIYKTSNCTLIESILWVSILSFIGLGLLFFIWIKKYLSPVIAFVISMLVLLLSPVADLARDLTPDALSTFLILFSVYAFCYLHRGWLIALMALAILARVDNFILVGVIGVILFFEKSESNGGKVWGIISILLGASLFLAIPSLVGNTNDWVGKFSHTFSIKQYMSELAFSVNAFRYSHFQVLLIIGIILLPHLKRLDRFEIKILLIIFLTMGGRLFLFPSFQDRFFIAYELLVIIVLARLMWRIKNGKYLF